MEYKTSSERESIYSDHSRKQNLRKKNIRKCSRSNNVTSPIQQYSENFKKKHNPKVPHFPNHSEGLKKHHCIFDKPTVIVRSNSVPPKLPLQNNENDCTKKSCTMRTRSESPNLKRSRRKFNSIGTASIPSCKGEKEKKGGNNDISQIACVGHAINIPNIHISNEGNESKISIPEHEYLQFALHITEDIIRNDMYTSEGMHQIFESHIKANSDRLDMNKMLKQIETLSKDLGIIDSEEMKETPYHPIANYTESFIKDYENDSKVKGNSDNLLINETNVHRNERNDIQNETELNILEIYSENLDNNNIFLTNNNSTINSIDTKYLNSKFIKSKENEHIPHDMLISPIITDSIHTRENSCFNSNASSPNDELVITPNNSKELSLVNGDSKFTSIISLYQDAVLKVEELEKRIQPLNVKEIGTQTSYHYKSIFEDNKDINFKTDISIINLPEECNLIDEQPEERSFANSSEKMISIEQSYDRTCVNTHNFTTDARITECLPLENNFKESMQDSNFSNMYHTFMIDKSSSTSDLPTDFKYEQKKLYFAEKLSREKTNIENNKGDFVSKTIAKDKTLNHMNNIPLKSISEIEIKRETSDYDENLLLTDDYNITYCNTALPFSIAQFYPTVGTQTSNINFLSEKEYVDKPVKQVSLMTRIYKVETDLSDYSVSYFEKEANAEDPELDMSEARINNEDSEESKATIITQLNKHSQLEVKSKEELFEEDISKYQQSQNLVGFEMPNESSLKELAKTLEDAISKQLKARYVSDDTNNTVNASESSVSQSELSTNAVYCCCLKKKNPTKDNSRPKRKPLITSEQYMSTRNISNLTVSHESLKSINMKGVYTSNENTSKHLSLTPQGIFLNNNYNNNIVNL